MNTASSPLDADNFDRAEYPELIDCEIHAVFDHVNTVRKGVIVSSSNIKPGFITLRVIFSGEGVIDVYIPPDKIKTLPFRLHSDIKKADDYLTRNQEKDR